MVRSYVCILAFVAVRIDDVVSLNFLFGNIEDPLFRRTVNEYFFSFVPLIIAEIVMVWFPSFYNKNRIISAKNSGLNVQTKMSKIS